MASIVSSTCCRTCTRPVRVAPILPVSAAWAAGQSSRPVASLSIHVEPHEVLACSRCRRPGCWPRAGAIRKRLDRATSTSPSAAGDHRRTSAATRAPPATASAATTAASERPRSPTDEAVSGNTVEIIVNVDDPPRSARPSRSRLGQTVVLRLLSDTDQEYHVHGYDLEKQAAAGVEATFEFTADTAGGFEVESHTTDAVLATSR